MATYQTITKNLNVKTAEAFISDVKDNSSYYIFTAKHTPYSVASDDVVPVAKDTVKSSIDIYNDMIFGKRIKPDDIQIMAKRYDWTLNTVYDMYLDNDPDLLNKKFFVVVNEGINYNVYKCLYNNNGGPSTVEPSGYDVDAFETVEDGYVWKYLYTVDEFEWRRFSTASYMPVIANTSVINSAQNGSIDVILVDQTNSGSGYNNYTTGSFLKEEDLRYNNNSKVYGLGDSAVAIDGFYVGCLIKITSGNANNEYRKIVDYTIIDGKKLITVDSEFDQVIRQTDTYEIYPNVFIYDTGATATVNCVARAMISANTGNSIHKIDIINPGLGYRQAIARLEPNSTVNVTEAANLAVVISPPGGHGSNINYELFSKYVGISTSFIGDSAPLTIENKYRTIGLLKDPTFSNVGIALDSSKTVGSFIPNETVYRYKPIKLFGNVALFSNSLVVGTDPIFTNSFRTDDRVIISNGTENFFSTVIQITGNNQLIVDKTPPFSGTNCSIFLTDSAVFGKVSDYSDVNKVYLKDVIPSEFDKSSSLVGDSSYCTVFVNSISTGYVTVNGRDAEGFNAFNQLYSLVGTLTTSTGFIENEIITQGDGNELTDPRAYYTH